MWSWSRDAADPVAQVDYKLLNDGTKELILNSVARQPRTIAGLAKELGLSQPTVHGHVNDLLASELLRDSLEWEKRHPAENYYEPNFPIIKAADRSAFDQVCRLIADQIADAFEGKMPDLRRSLEKNTLAIAGWEFSDVAQFCYASAQREARKILERRGHLPSREKHRNGAEWTFWAEEPGAGEKNR